MFRKFPTSLKPLFAQLGGEWQGPLFARGVLRPVAAADFQKHQQNGWWNTGVSVRAGVQMQNLLLRTRSLQLLVEYYSGHDPNGQFFAEKLELLGLGGRGRGFAARQQRGVDASDGTRIEQDGHRIRAARERCVGALDAVRAVDLLLEGES